MKKKRQADMKLMYVFLTFILSTPLTCFAQKGYEAGYVVLSINDTLHGTVKDRKDHPFGGLYKRIKFKNKRGKRTYRPNQILGYKRGESLFERMWLSASKGFLNQNYRVFPGVGKQHFLKVVHKGFLSYYYWEFEDDDSGYIDRVGYFKKQGDSSLVRVSQGIFGLRRKSLAKFFDDCPELAMKIRNKTIHNPIEIVQFYNAWKGEN